MFTKVLVANRGEIAVRVLRALREMGIASVAVYSEPDADSPHVRLADEAYPLPGTTSAETYLRQDLLLEIIRQSGAEAVHPGYGFLSESPEFATALAAAGITLIGPPASVVAAMGDKVEARRRMAAAGVPVVPGFEETGAHPDRRLHAAEELGYPILVKAAAGGGGKGMRRVAAAGELLEAAESARREALAAFGDGRVYLEKLIEQPRHVEFQIFGDRHGNAVHLFERECSIQRRHQKVLEESPSPALTPELRAAMGEAAVRAAREIGYENAGTVEFLLGADGGFYFLEVNARLQVEHPVTEAVTGLDLVHLQLRVAAGEALPFSQEALQQRGHALECRVYAEDPRHDFFPQSGTLDVYRPPAGPGIRVDTGFREGQPVSVHYDPLLAKVTVHAPDRDTAIARMDQALREFAILGLRTNVSFLRAVLADPRFRSGAFDTSFLEQFRIPDDPTPPPEAFAAAALALHQPATPRQHPGNGEPESPWHVAGAWRQGAPQR